MVSSSSIIVFFLSVFIILCTTEALVKLPRNETFPAVLVFGDSIVDPGNNNNLSTLVKCNFPPYGRDFVGGFPTGRFSNGKIPPDFIGTSILFLRGLIFHDMEVFCFLISCNVLQNETEIFIFGMFWKRKYTKPLRYWICLVLNYVRENKGYPNQAWRTKANRIFQLTGPMLFSIGLTGLSSWAYLTRTAWDFDFHNFPNRKVHSL